MRLRFLLTSLVLAPVCAMAQQGDWRSALEEMRRYCMAEICIGMSVHEVASLPRGQLEIWSTADWARNCTGSYAHWNHAYFTSKDGTKFNVGFRDYPGPEEEKKRFRVQSIAVYLEVTRGELNDLRETLTARYGMQPAGNSVAPLQEWKTSAPLFDATVSTSFADPPKRSLLLLSAKSDRYPEWLRTQPACHSERRPLPKL